MLDPEMAAQTIERVSRDHLQNYGEKHKKTKFIAPAVTCHMKNMVRIII